MTEEAILKRLSALESRVADLEDALRYRERFEAVAAHGPTSAADFAIAQERAKRETLGPMNESAHITELKRWRQAIINEIRIVTNIQRTQPYKDLLNASDADISLKANEFYRYYSTRAAMDALRP